MALDEIVQTCPVPLPTWLADSGGKGIQLIPVAHGEAQLRTRWGKDGAQVVLDTCGVKVWLPGITDTATLKMASELCGQAAFTERVRYHGRRPGRGPPDLARRDDPGHDPPASRRARPGHPRRLCARHRPARRRLEGPRLQARPPPRHRRRRPHPGRTRPALTPGKSPGRPRRRTWPSCPIPATRRPAGRLTAPRPAYPWS